MKRNEKTTDVVSFSLPVQLIAQLRTSVGQREMSKFAARALQDALKQEQEKLRTAYQAAANDPARNELLNEWSTLDVEGLDVDEEW